MLRLAFDFIITWRETRTRPNAYPKYLLWNNYFKSSIAWYHASGWAETESIWGN